MSTTTRDLSDTTIDTLDRLEISVIDESGDMRHLGNAAEGPWGWYRIEAIEAAAQVAEDYEGEEHERLNVFASALAEGALPEPTTLDDLAEQLRSRLRNLSDDLPTFGGQDIADTQLAGYHAVWSWDETRVLIASDASDVEIVDRASVRGDDA